MVVLLMMNPQDDFKRRVWGMRVPSLSVFCPQITEKIRRERSKSAKNIDLAGYATNQRPDSQNTRPLGAQPETGRSTPGRTLSGHIVDFPLPPFPLEPGGVQNRPVGPFSTLPGVIYQQPVSKKGSNLGAEVPRHTCLSCLGGPSPQTG